MIKLLVFDFDGTLADSRKILLNLVKKEIKNSEYRISKAFVKRFGDKPLNGILKMIGFGNNELDYYSREIHKDFFKNAGKIKACKNLKSLKKIRIKKIVLSNSIHKFISIVLRNLGVMKYFEHVFGADEFKNKVQEFRKIIKIYKIKPREIAYVGDRVIDAKLARKIGCYSIIILRKSSWSPRKDIVKARPDFIVSDLGKVKEIVERL